MKKLSFLELEKEMDVLSKDEINRIKAGNGGGPNGYCVFNSMAALDDRYGSGNHSYLDFFSAFVGAYGAGDIEYGANGQIIGIETGAGSNYRQFMDNHFNTHSVSTVGDIINAVNNPNEMVEAAYGNHNIILTGYDAQSNQYTYNDATTGEKNLTLDATKMVNGKPVSTVSNAFGVTGEKDYWPTTTVNPSTTMPTTTIPINGY